MNTIHTLQFAQQTIVSPWWMYHLPAYLFIFCFGACVGSFLNVIIYRLPAGMSVITPPSRCPTCGARLSWRENLPILGWFLLRGKCRRCGVRISAQYMIIETIVAFLFVGLALLYYLIRPVDDLWWTQIGGEWWYWNGLARTWPAFLAILFLLAGLIAMTVIDARTFTIPIEIPTFVTVSAFSLIPLQALLPASAREAQAFAMPLPDGLFTMIAFGGMAGVVTSFILLKKGIFRYSFADYDEYVKDDEPLAEYPHGRREMLVELKYLLPILAGLTLGGLIGWFVPAEWPLFIRAVGATFLGYLAGGAMIWTTRILGTFAFGREAMGLGDVHLLAAVGAVLGWEAVVWAFFTAPFIGLGWTLLALVIALFSRKFRRELPYGPHLAIGTLVVLLAWPAIEWFKATILFPAP